MSYEYYGPGLGTDDSASTEEEETVFEQGWEWFREIAGKKTDQPSAEQPAPMPGATPDGKPSSESFAEYAREAAVRETAAVDEEIAPFQETSPDDPAEEEERSWGERYQTHITLISTLVGLGTFVAWLLLRKNSNQ